MQITALSRRFVAIALGASLLAVPSVLGPTGPASGAEIVTSGGRVGPGTQLVTGGRSCTANFVFRDARRRVFVGYAASCAVRKAATAGNACSARPLPRGTRVRLADRGRTLGYGVLRYSWLVHRRDLGDEAEHADRREAHDEVRQADHDLVEALPELALGAAERLG